MTEIQTAEEVLIKHYSTYNYAITSAFCEVTLEAMRDFAKLHVEQFAKDFNLSCEYRQQLVETYINKIV